MQNTIQDEISYKSLDVSLYIIPIESVNVQPFDYSHNQLPTLEEITIG